MKKINKVIILSIATISFFLLGCSTGEEKKISAASGGSSNVAISIGANVGERLPEKVFKTFDGKDILIPPKDGKVYVINVWATWCPPCRVEMPDFQLFYEKYKDSSSVGFYAINLAEDVNTVKNFLDANSYTFPILLDDKNESVKMLRTNGIPTTVVIDRDGVVVFRKIGPTTHAELEDAVKKALG